MFDDMYIKPQVLASVPSEHTIYMVVELSTEPGKVFLSSTFTTGIKNFKDLGQELIEFPVKIKDLSVYSTVTIKIYDMNRITNGGLVSQSIFDLYDCKKRLRQGVIDLYCSIDGEEETNFTTKINDLLARVGQEQVKDRKTEEAIKRQLDEYYEESK